MDIVIVKGDFNDSYRNTGTCIAFSIKGTLIYIDQSAWSINEIYLLSGEPLSSFSTLFKKCNATDVFGKKCDNLLVEADFFYHFMGLVLCNAKCLQFILYIYKEDSCPDQQVFYSTILLLFNLMELLVLFALHKKISLKRLQCHFWWLLNKNIFYTISSCITVLNLKFFVAHLIHIEYHVHDWVLYWIYIYTKTNNLFIFKRQPSQTL